MIRQVASCSEDDDVAPIPSFAALQEARRASLLHKAQDSEEALLHEVQQLAGLSRDQCKDDDVIPLLALMIKD